MKETTIRARDLVALLEDLFAWEPAVTVQLDVYGDGRVIRDIVAADRRENDAVKVWLKVPTAAGPHGTRTMIGRDWVTIRLHNSGPETAAAVQRAGGRAAR